jgi:hypothetical protein
MEVEVELASKRYMESHPSAIKVDGKKEKCHGGAFDEDVLHFNIMGYTNNKSLTSLGSEQSRTNPLPSP